MKSSLATSQQVNDRKQNLGDEGLTSDDGEVGVLRKVGFSHYLLRLAAREQFA